MLWPLGRASAHFVAQKLEAKKAQPYYLEFCHTEAGSGCGKYVLVPTRMYELSTFLVLYSGCATPTVEVCAGKALVASTYIEQWLSSFGICRFFCYILQFCCGFLFQTYTMKIMQNSLSKKKVIFNYE